MQKEVENIRTDPTEIENVMKEKEKIVFLIQWDVEKKSYQKEDTF